MEDQMPKKKKRHLGCLITLLVFVLLIGGAALFAYSFYNNEVNGNRKIEAVESVEVIIEKGSGPLTIGKELQKNGIITQPQIFRYYVKHQGMADQLQAGKFTFSSDMSYDDIIDVLMTQEVRESTRVTIPEGKSVVQIAQAMEQAGLCTADEFMDAVNNADFSAEGLTCYSYIIEQRSENAAEGLRLEGFLFPDTYDFFLDDTPYNFVLKMLKNFDSKVTPDMYTRMDELGMNLTQVITLASIVQEEAGDEANSAHVSSVFHNRLNDGWSLESNTSSYIQNDADNNYVYNILAGSSCYGSWDAIPQNVRTAYDTYAAKGLPPAPISNPGIISITAALYPTDSTDYFFVTDAVTGEYYYAQTANQHYQNCVKAGWA